MERHPTNTEKKEKGQLITTVSEYEESQETNPPTLEREEKSVLKEDDKSSDTSKNSKNE